MAKHDFEVPKNEGDYYVRAITELYPTLRNGVDFVVARVSTEDPYVIEKLNAGAGIDDLLVTDAAAAMLAQDPYAAYTPHPV